MKKVDNTEIDDRTGQENFQFAVGIYAHQFINKAFIAALSFPNYHLGITQRISGLWEHLMHEIRRGIKFKIYDITLDENGNNKDEKSIDCT